MTDSASCHSLPRGAEYRCRQLQVRSAEKPVQGIGSAADRRPRSVLGCTTSREQELNRNSSTMQRRTETSKTASKSVPAYALTRDQVQRCHDCE